MTNPYDIPAPHQATIPTKKPMSTGKKVGIGAVSAIVLIAIGSAMGGGDKEPAANVTTFPNSTATVAAASIPTTTVKAGPKTSFGPGIYLVGSQIVAGQYQSPGGSNCYFERRSNTSSDFDGIITNEWSTDHSQQIVTIDPTDVAFKSSGCGQWIRME